MNKRREAQRNEHFINWCSMRGAGFGKENKPDKHPLALYFEKFKTNKGKPIEYALIGHKQWVSVTGTYRQARQLNQWQQDFCRKFEQIGGEGAVTWEEIAGLARGTSTSLHRRGRRTAVQLTLPLILKRQTSTRATRETRTTA
jgi:hypothetical protein